MNWIIEMKGDKEVRRSCRVMYPADLPEATFQAIQQKVCETLEKHEAEINWTRSYDIDTDSEELVATWSNPEFST